MTIAERHLRLDPSALARLAAIPAPAPRRVVTPRFLAILAFALSALAAGRSLPRPTAEETPMKSKLSVLATAAFASCAFATDRLVPQQYPTIQAAVDASVNGDRVLISPGLYRESVNLDGKAVFLQGSDPARVHQVVLTGVGVPGGPVNAPTRPTYVGLVGMADLTIDGLGVLEANEDAGAFFGELGPAASLEVRHCILKNIRTGSQNGGAMLIAHNTSAVSIRDCLFRSNASMNHGEALYLYDGVHAMLENCVVDSHVIGDNVFYARLDAVMQVTHCVIREANTLSFHFQSGVVVCSSNIGCEIAAVTNGGYIDGGNNNWTGPCPDCDGDGVIDLEEMLFDNGDCNGNGLLDACEIPEHPNWDRNNDGVIDACQCLADISGNGTVDGVDLAAVLGSWGASGGGKTGADIDGDGIVSGTDLALVLGGWGPCPN